MNSQKPFDCIEYKRAIQEKHASGFAGLRPEEVLQKRGEWLEQSDNPAARLWRKMKQKQQQAAHSQ